MGSVLRIEKISKSFSGVEVLHQVDFELGRGEIHALVGENGAGKSTLMKIFMGEHKPDSGDIYLNGKKVLINSAREALEMGIAMVHQELHYMERVSVADYMLLGREPSKWGFLDKKKQIGLTYEYLDRIGLKMNPNLKMGELSVSEIQMIEIAKVISLGSNILILDEPTSSLSESEAETLFRILLELKKQGVSIIYISHRLEELFKIADRVTVLRDGYYIDSRPIKGIDRDTMIQMMVGRRLEEVFPPVNQDFGDELIRVENLSKKGKFDGIEFRVRRGEVLGLAGLVGAGRTEIVTALFGMMRIDEGMVYIENKPVSIKNPIKAVQMKIALVTEDRKKYGLNLLGSVSDNIAIFCYKDVCRWGFLNRRGINRCVTGMIERLQIKTNSERQIVRSLSGGNQQKVVLAKWLLNSPDVIILDEPTRGIDIGAKAEIYKIISSLAAQGKALILISSEMPEIIGLCYSVLVVRNGGIVGRLSREEISQEKIMHLASG